MMKNLLLFALTVVLLNCHEKQAPSLKSPVAPDPRLDFTIVPGERVGLLTKDHCSKADVLAAYGEYAKVDQVDVGQGLRAKGVVIFEGQSHRRVQVYWTPAPISQRPGFIKIDVDRMAGGDSDWKLENGLTIGSTMEEVEMQNGAPFEFWGFDWAYGGRVANWNGGTLAGKGVRMFFGASTGEIDEKIKGEGSHLSNEPLVRQASPKVVSLELTFPVQKQLPACLAEKVRELAGHKSIFTILKMKVGGENLYRVRNEEVTHEGVDYIYDENCNEKCRWVSFQKPPVECRKAYLNGRWEPVWEHY